MDKLLAGRMNRGVHPPCFGVGVGHGHGGPDAETPDPGWIGGLWFAGLSRHLRDADPPDPAVVPPLILSLLLIPEDAGQPSATMEVVLGRSGAFQGEVEVRGHDEGGTCV